MACNGWLTLKVAKFLMIAANIFYMLSGVAMVVVAAGLRTGLDNYNEFFDGRFIPTTIAVVVVGSLTGVVGLCGCGVAFTKSRRLLVTYSALLIGVLLVTLSVGIVALTQVGKSGQFVNDNFHDFFDAQYNVTGPARPPETTFDLIQEKFGCCGANGPSDFTLLRMTVSSSCCSSGDFQAPCTIVTAHRTGCSTAFSDWLQRPLDTVGILCVCVAVCQVIAVVLALFLAQIYKFYVPRYDNTQDDPYENF